MMPKRFLLSLSVLLGLAGLAPAQVVYLDRRIHRPPTPPRPQTPAVPQGRLILKSYRSEVSIQDRLVQTTLTQKFHNPLAMQVEGHYVFPVPPQAAVSDFRMSVNGKMIKGEVLDKGKAREVYEGIVRRQRDPGLLEYLGYGLIQASIFPIPANSDLDVSITWSSSLDKHGQDLYAYREPWKACKLSGLPSSAISVHAELRSTIPLKMIYSPSHNVEVIKKDELHATVSYEGGGPSDRDFELYFSLSDKAFGVTALTHRRPGSDGFFALTLSPSLLSADQVIPPKDIVFVVDTSGSMQGDKIAHVREALTYCLQSLAPKDRFNVVPFSTVARPFAETLVQAGEDNVQAALKFIGGLEAAGGTNIGDALQAGLRLDDQSEGRPFQLFFLTDGLPTVGETDAKTLLEGFRAGNQRSVRLFALGVGHDVNTFLLDKLSSENRGTRDYVVPGESLEVKISSLYARIAKPALVDIGLELPGLGSYELYPPVLPDLFHGEDLLVLGRYRGEGPCKVRLSGHRAGTRMSWEYGLEFPRVQSEDRFLSSLWATRKVGYLLDQIRLNGASKELVDAVIETGTQYGIVTPYTSNLIVEEQELEGLASLSSTAARGRFFGFAEDSTVRRERGVELRRRLGRLGKVAEGESADASGGRAVQDSLEALRFSTAKSAPSVRGGGGPASAGVTSPGAKKQSQGPRKIHRVQGRMFYRVGPTWFDEKSQDKKDIKPIRIEAFSEAYFALLTSEPELAEILALGPSIVFHHKGTVYEIFEP